MIGNLPRYKVVPPTYKRVSFSPIEVEIDLPQTEQNLFLHQLISLSRRHHLVLENPYSYIAKLSLDDPWLVLYFFCQPSACVAVQWLEVR